MLYRLLAEESYAARMPWDRTFVFWDEERWVPADDEQSNQRIAATSCSTAFRSPGRTYGRS